MKKTIYPFFVLFLLVQSLAAQVDSVYQEPSEWKSGFFIRVPLPYINYGIASFPHMRQEIKAAKVDNFDRIIYFFPFEAGWRTRDWLFGLNVALPLAYRKQSFAFATASIERAVLKTRNYRVNLFVSGGYYEYAFSYTRKDPNQQISTQNLFSSSLIGSPELMHKGGMMNVGLALMSLEKRRVSMSSYARIGYSFGFKSTRWTSPTATIIAAPSDRFGMAYIQYLFHLSRNK
jgi:hypothetical protein